MKIEIPNKVLAAVALGGACFAAGLVAAAEFPSTGDVLTYSGRLTDSAGNPRTTTETITVTLFDAANGGTSLCAASQPAVNLGDTQGRFSVPLPSLCTNALTANGDAWAEVKVGSTTLPRQKLGAVPYALVAQTVTAGAVGESELAPAVHARIAAAEDRIDEVAADLDGLAGLPYTRWLVQENLAAEASKIHASSALSNVGGHYDTEADVYRVSRTGLYLVTGTLVTNNIADQCGLAFHITKQTGSSVSAHTYQYAGRASHTGTNRIAAAINIVLYLFEGEWLAFNAIRSGSCNPIQLNADLQVTFLR